VLAFGGLSVAPVQARGDAQDGSVSIGVIGNGLRGQRARALLDGWDPGAEARDSQWKRSEYVRSVRGWKAGASWPPS
jgi:hypothetical protein